MRATMRIILEELLELISKVCLKNFIVESHLNPPLFKLFNENKIFSNIYKKTNFQLPPHHPYSYKYILFYV